MDSARNNVTLKVQNYELLLLINCSVFVSTLCKDLIANVFANCLLSQTAHHTSGVADWHLSLSPWSLCFKMLPLPFIFNQHCLIEIIDFFFFFLPLLGKWKTLVIKHFVSKSKFQDRHQHLRKIGNSLKQKKKKKKKKEVAKMWKEETGNEIMNGVRASYLSQAERH